VILSCLSALVRLKEKFYYIGTVNLPSMKKLYSLLSFLLVFSTIPSFGQDSTRYYVTIGAFSKVENATRFVETVGKQGLDAKYALHPKNKLNFVYVLNTTNKREAFALAIKLRVETEHKETWVYVGSFAEENFVKIVPTVEEKPLEPDTKPADSTQLAKQPEEIKPQPETNPVIDSTQMVKPEEGKTPAIDSTQMAKPVVDSVASESHLKKHTGRPFYFKLIKSTDGSEIKTGQVHVQEALNATQYQAFNVGEVIYLEAPKNNRRSYTVVTQVPGYSPVTTVFDYQSISQTKTPEQEVIVELPMTKAKRGDYIDFNEVKFYKNAAILYPSSQNELDGVVDLMKENAKYKIKIHGHVNGAQVRESFLRGPNSSFFAPNPSADQTIKGMSDKALSLARAETVRDYLISQGIDVSRISVKGEGGRIPLYPEGGSYGHLNDRVEIEFIRN
jgi:outer membrane protein OmpA-like peptidoglycan-associated protein